MIADWITNRQLQALRLRCAGKTATDIADQLAIAPASVATLFRSVRNRLGGQALDEICRELTGDGEPGRATSAEPRRLWRSAILPDGTIRSDAYTIVGDCHLWTGRLERGYPVDVYLNQKIRMRSWIAGVAPTTPLVNTCGHRHCINRRHLQPESFAPTRELLARIPPRLLTDAQRRLLDRLADGATPAELMMEYGTDTTGMNARIGKARERLALAVKILEREGADAERRSRPGNSGGRKRPAG